MALYTIGDLHLSESSGKPMDVFGGVWQDYRRKIVEAFSQTLKEDDTVVLCGDLSWGLNLEQALADFKLVDSFLCHKNMKTPSVTIEYLTADQSLFFHLIKDRRQRSRLQETCLRNLLLITSVMPA